MSTVRLEGRLISPLVFKVVINYYHDPSVLPDGLFRLLVPLLSLNDFHGFKAVNKKR